MFDGGNCCEADLKDFNAFFIVSISLSLKKEFGLSFFLILSVVGRLTRGVKFACVSVMAMMLTRSAVHSFWSMC